jgi:protein-tyrosine phosphatase
MRHLPFAGTPNFRDLGGYATVDGRQVKWGYLFRSGQLSNLNQEDQQKLQALQLDVVCDFRREEEQERDPSLLPTPGPRHLSVSISPGSNDSFFSEATEMNVDRQAMYDFMVEINRDFALGQTDAYSTMFSHLVQDQPTRMLFHCAAGKDRTGFAAAIILLALGVPRRQVMEDYLLTSEYFIPHREMSRLAEKYEMDLPAETMLPVLEVHAEYLQAALDAIDEQFESLEHYLQDYLGLDGAGRERLRSHYLE